MFRRPDNGGSWLLETQTYQNEARSAAESLLNHSALDDN
jgi:hypothetical protein